ncbi:hypothetical protein BKA63DRAFT_140631 [Paraphoma chrysanthemicola]|nr:hypothetical protein BKA63DRAFT_140631 [Paraphoma chrysanthemicola]
MSTTAPVSSFASNRPLFACIRCAERKVKCDRQQPCSACIKHSKECVFNPSKPPRKRNRRIKIQSLIDQLNHYEVLLQKNGILPAQSPNTTHADSGVPISRSDTSRPEKTHPSLPFVVLGDPVISSTISTPSDLPFTYVENHLWRRVIEESHDPGESADRSDMTSEESDDDQRFVLTSHVNPSNKPRHPPSEKMRQLWEIFVENVDPLTKVVHVPTLRPVVHKAFHDTQVISRSLEALLFSIYGAAIMSLKDAECQDRFLESRRSLLSRYTSAARKALSRARFMETTNLMVLQALLLHLFAVRDIYAPRAVYSMTGVAVRIAQTMGLDRDGTSLGLSPFETELRRRIWWQIKLHDFRTAELCGLAKFRDLDLGAESPRFPTNLDDDQLHPGMTSLVGEVDKVTDVLFVVFRCEMTNFAASRVAEFRKQGKDPSMWALHTQDQSAKARAFTELQDTLESKYLRYCDPSRPLHLLTMLVGRYGMNVVKFLTNHPRKWISLEQTPVEEKRLVWDVSINLLEQHDMVQSNPMLKSFSWHATYFQQWHAFIHVLDVLRAEPFTKDAVKAWKIIGNTYENTPAMSLDMKKPLHIAVSKLCLKAYDARERSVHVAGLHPEPIPAFVSQLRQRWGMIKSRQRSQNEKMSNVKFFGHTVDHGSENSNSLPLADESLTESIMTEYGRLRASHVEDAGCTAGDVQSNAFDSHADCNDDPQPGSTNMEFDIPMTESYSMDDFDMTTIDWAQWDAWLADSNVMRPFPV